MQKCGKAEAGFDQGFGEGIELTCEGGLNFRGIKDLKIGKGLTVRGVSEDKQYGLTGLNRVQMDWRKLLSSQNNILLLPSLAVIKKEKLIWFESESLTGLRTESLDR